MNVLIAVSLAYVSLLFLVAFLAERRANSGKSKWLRSPWVYTLSLSVYCTAWTFYGAVGYAARSGFEFLTIYLGPSLVMFGWWWILRKLVRIGRTHRVTSIADLISSRFGKSNSLGVIATILAVIGTTPYIALQLQSVTLSIEVFAQAEADPLGYVGQRATAFWIACGLAFFTILFGTRNLDANERHDGVVIAIAVEAVVKLFALLAVGAFVVWGIAGGIGDMFNEIDQSRVLGHWRVNNSRWAALIFISAAAFLCLPRMFQVLVVENDDERHLQTASWAFPLYVLLMSLFVVPIAVIGLKFLPDGANPDLFVLTLPLSMGQTELAILSFLGGFSSATSMVVVAAIALSTMVSNHIVMPIWLRFAQDQLSMSGDVRRVVLLTRRISIGIILWLGYVYFQLSGGGAALASIGLVSFTGVSQVLPAMIGGIFWRGATRSGAIAGILIGFALWLFTLFLPSFGEGVVLSSSVFHQGLLGIGWLRPYALLGIEGLDPLVHAIWWSISLNTIAFVIVSLMTFPSPQERLQGAQFVDVFRHTGAPRSWSGRAAQAEDLLIMAQRILGPKEAQTLFRGAARRQGRDSYLPDPSPDFLQELERHLSGSVGAATAHAMVSQIVGGASVSVQDLMAVADETAQMLEYSNTLEVQSKELERTANQLSEANIKLTRLSVQKDAFLSQISHELRTPMTSIRAFSEILRDAEEMSLEQKSRYASIIHDETIRLTRLLDDLLDLSVLENGQVNLNLSRGNLADILERAVTTVNPLQHERPLDIVIDPMAKKIDIHSDLDRLAQVFINLIANAQKYCDAPTPVLRIDTRKFGSLVQMDFIDNGKGLPEEARDVVFEKFSRLGENKAGGAGLGLAICREILTRCGGGIGYVPAQQGAAFRVEFLIDQTQSR